MKVLILASIFFYLLLIGSKSMARKSTCGKSKDARNIKRRQRYAQCKARKEASQAMNRRIQQATSKRVSRDRQVEKARQLAQNR